MNIIYVLVLVFSMFVNGFEGGAIRFGIIRDFFNQLGNSMIFEENLSDDDQISFGTGGDLTIIIPEGQNSSEF